LKAETTVAVDDDLSANHQVSVWLRRLSQGDLQAVEVIWRTYFDRVVALARHKLGSTPRREFDEEDVALSAMNSFFQRAADGQFSELNDRDNLWKLLVAITAGKIRDQRRRGTAQKRGGGKVRGESVFVQADGQGQVSIEQVLVEEPSPSTMAELMETYPRKLDCLADPVLRDIAVQKMEGYTNDEISRRTGRSVATIERKLQRIRKIWGSELRSS
jgi:DNA-directed RNA polymerase specialized sigma24 family protein